MTQSEGSAYVLAVGVVTTMAYLTFRGATWYDMLVVLALEFAITLGSFIGGYTSLAKRLGIPDAALPLEDK